MPNVDFTSGFTSDFSPLFELDIVVKDAMGNPTKKRKSCVSDSAEDIWKFWMRHQGKPKRKTTRKLPTAKETNQILTNLYGKS